ncbi:MAG: glycosyltransferase family 39 protein [Planctomycetota bacterium]
MWRRDLVVLGLIALASLGVRAAMAARCGIFQDEGIYWWDAHYTGVGFCPSPPASAAAVVLGEGLLGSGMLGLRAGALVAGTAIVVMAWGLARELFGGRAGLWAAALAAACPFFVALGTVTTPEPFLVVAWLGFVWLTWRAVKQGSGPWWAAAGVVLAMGLYSKYMMVLAVPCLLVGLWMVPAWRPALRRAGPWLAVGLGLGLFVPVFLWWNAGHEWTAVRFHLGSRHHWTASWTLAARYIFGHARVLSPVIYVGILFAFVVCGRLWWRTRHAAAGWVLAFGVLPILFFLPPSVFTEWTSIREHWDVVGYATGLVGLAAVIDGLGRADGAARRALGVVALVTALLASACVAVAVVWPQTAVALGTRPPTRKMLGWERLADRVRATRAAWDGPPPIVTGSFTPALCLGFHLRERGAIYTLDHERNHDYGLAHQLELWGIDEAILLRQHAGEDVLYVHEYRVDDDEDAIEDPPDRILTLCAEVEPLGHVAIVYGGQPVRLFGLFRARALRATAPPPDEP